MSELKSLKDLFTVEELDDIYKEGRAIEEDILFLNLMSSRLKSGIFDFKVVPTKKSSIHQKFLTELYLKMYDFKGIDYVLAYKAAIKCFDELNNVAYNKSTVLTICNNLYNNYGILLSEYVGSFIGCSLQSTRVENILDELLSDIKN